MTSITFNLPEKVFAALHKNLNAFAQHPRANPIDVGLPDSTALIREDRDGNLA
mgnify:CR=1 FL=1